MLIHFFNVGELKAFELNESYESESLYLFLDQPYYTSEENVHFSLYLESTEGQRSEVIYVALLNH